MHSCYSKNDWDNLETVYLGSFVDPRFVSEIFDHSKLAPFLPHLTKIANETYDDLNKFQQQLEDRGITVIRPDQDKITEMQANESEKFKLTLQDVSIPADLITRIPIPISPRNDFMVYGSDLFVVNEAADLYSLDRLSADNVYTYTDEYMHVPSITRLDNRLVLGHDITEKQSSWLKERIHNTEFYHATIQGHVDAALACVRDGLLIASTRYPQEVYTNAFPGWDMVSTSGQGWVDMCNKIAGDRPIDNIINAVKEYTNDSWWIDGLENDANIEQVSNIINTYFSNWFGYSEETYFEVNCLTVNPDLSFVISDGNSSIATDLKKYNHEVIPVTWRNRWFFDQGLHCITTDIKRTK